MSEETKWGTPQHWGTLKIRYKPTGEVRELKLGNTITTIHLKALNVSKVLFNIELNLVKLPLLEKSPASS
ncbi:unnamed protein product [marine sediment metagenome]|uniref:Uncharacterized protein n=1 Tax=marine sediment metagenome TaxID=412755 RepID=X1UL37_9ZZZZ